MKGKNEGKKCFVSKLVVLAAYCYPSILIAILIYFNLLGYEKYLYYKIAANNVMQRTYMTNTSVRLKSKNLTLAVICFIILYPFNIITIY